MSAVWVISSSEYWSILPPTLNAVIFDSFRDEY